MRKLEIIGAAVVVGAILVITATVYAAEIGFGIKTDVTAADVGLPAYPGSWKYAEKQDSDSAARLWGSFGAFGMKLAVVQLATNDEPTRVAAFYRQALRKHGPVLDCSRGQPRPPKAAKDSDALDCSDDHTGAGEFVLKSGSKKDFHVVGIEPQGRGSKIGLVSIQLRGVH